MAIMEHKLHTTPTLSHEINNYLTIVYSQLQHIEYIYKYLSKDELWIQMKSDFDSVFHLLAQNMEEENLMCTTSEPTLLSSFLLHLYQSWNPRLADQHIQFSIPTEIEHVELSASKQQLEHIFHNLLTNSYDAICQKNTPENYSNFISIETELQSKILQIKIQDSGCGMTQQQLSKVLNPGVSYKENGHGFGLPLVLEIMDALNGDFHIFSSPGRGTTILLNFPL
jgi:signal transduction histidine kinase